MVQKKILIESGYLPANTLPDFCLEIGAKILGYKITEIIANKSNVVIYAAQDANKQKWALKVVHKDKFETEKQFQKAIASLQQETDLLRQLAPIEAVLNVKGFFQQNTFAFMAMEYIPGINLKNWVEDTMVDKAFKKETVRQLLRVFIDIHARGIVHGDIHSSNFIMDKNRLRIIDFGIGHHEIPEDNELLRKGGVVYYMPPERIQLTVFEKFTAISSYLGEVYQLGVIIYYIYYEKVPFLALT